MRSRRSDLLIGLAAAVLLHGALLAAAGGLLRQRRAAFLASTPEATLEVLVVSEEAWRAQLEESQPVRVVKPIEAREMHTQAALPAWPEVELESVAFNGFALRNMNHRQCIEAPSPPPARPHELVASEALREGLEVQSKEQQADEPAVATMNSGPQLIEGTSSLVKSRPHLRYPSRPLRRGIEGRVRVGVEVGTDGEVSRSWIMKSSGNRELDRAASMYLRGWRFDVAQLANLTTRSFQNDVRFELE